jgi:hypothetical protein
MLKTIIRYFVITGMVFVLAWCFSGCGKKGPPSSPGYLAPPVVGDLNYQIIGDRLMLGWSTPESGESKVYDIAGARVYRFKAPVTNEVCKDCPLNLSFVTSIPFESRHMNYREVLEKGYHYAYQVILYDQADQEGEKSNMVNFTYE